MDQETYYSAQEEFEQMIRRRTSKESMYAFVVKYTPLVTCRYDFVFMINAVGKIEFGNKAYYISLAKLEELLGMTPIRDLYETFYIKKKSGKHRVIQSPTNELMLAQKYINKWFQILYTPPECATGFVAGRSVVDNAKRHIGKPFVFNIDIQDFFPSITRARVFSRLCLPDIGFSRYAATLIAKLCCCPTPECTKHTLPQGAPTSPTLSNIICTKLDNRLSKIARRYNLTYSRYADDITFSSAHFVYEPGSSFLRTLRGIISQEGFRINEGKTRLQTVSERQVVTGLTVNQGVNVSKAYIKRLRTILHNWEYSKTLAEKHFAERYNKQNINSKPLMENYVKGMLDYLLMVKGEDNPTYQKLFQRYTNCIQEED